MASEYALQIVLKSTGEVVQWAPGLRIETDLVADLVKRVVAKGVGFGRSSNHVAKDVEEAIKELFWDMKSQVHGLHLQD
jgi:hypothetical protein